MARAVRATGTDGRGASVPLARAYSLCMSAYNGQAWVVSEDGTDVPVTASLTSYPDGLRTGWGGTLTPASDGLPRLLNLVKDGSSCPAGPKQSFSAATPATG
jgi:hypothetical protein